MSLRPRKVWFSFVGTNLNQGAICIESCHVTFKSLQNQRVQSTSQNTLSALDNSANPHGFAMLLGHLRLYSRTVVAWYKLVVTNSSEIQHRSVPEMRFDTHVFDIDGLTFVQYVPMFVAKSMVFDAIAKDWVLYDVQGETPYDTFKMVAITDGHDSTTGKIRLTNQRTHILLVTRTSLCAYNPDEREGNIEIDHYNLIT